MFESTISSSLHNHDALEELFRNESWNEHIFTRIQTNMSAYSIFKKWLCIVQWPKKHVEEMHVKISNE